MTETVITARATPRSTAPSARRLLACGALAGPLFLAVTMIQMFTRSGFEPERHPMSLLSLGEFGWIQSANFIVAGLLFGAGAVGIRRALRATRGGTWGPILIGVFAVCLVWAGVFAADPSDGFPPGTPEGAGHITWHGMLHSFAPAVAFLALMAACLVFARRFISRRQRGWAAFSLATAIALLTPDLFFGQTMFVPMLGIAAVAGWGWASILAMRLMVEDARLGPVDRPHS